MVYKHYFTGYISVYPKIKSKTKEEKIVIINEDYIYIYNK